MNVKLPLPCLNHRNMSGFNFGIIVFGTISFTFWTVGANGLIAFTGLGWNRFRWASVNGVVLMRGRLFSGGRLGNKKPSSRWANHSENVVCFMPVFRAEVFKNNKEHRVLVEQGRGDGTFFYHFPFVAGSI
jgi:hypothetical protein